MKPTDLEDECAKCLLQLEMNNAGLKEHLTQIFINSADLVEYKQADGTDTKTLFVKIPYRSLNAFRKVSDKVVAHFEAKLNWPVIVVATRTIISKRGKELVRMNGYINSSEVISSSDMRAWIMTMLLYSD